MKKGCVETHDKETLCWKCANYSRCSWCDGIPVKGWKATPTVVHDSDKDYNSFLVEDCPLFEADKKEETTTEGIAQVLGRTSRSVASALRRVDSMARLCGALKEKGYKLHISIKPLKNGKKRREFILERLDRKQ